MFKSLCPFSDTLCIALLNYLDMKCKCHSQACIKLMVCPKLVLVDLFS